MRIRIISIVLICLTFAGGIIWYVFFKSPLKSFDLTLYTLDKTALLPYYDVSEYDYMSAHYYISYNINQTMNDLLSDTEPSDETKCFRMDLLTYLEYYASLNDYRIAAMQPKKLSLVLAPKHAGTNSLKAIKSSVFGITSQAADEFTLKNVLDRESITAFPLDEIILQSDSDKTLMLIDGYIDYTLLESPFEAYAISLGAKTLYSFNDTYDVLLMPYDCEASILKAFYAYIDIVNQNIDHYKVIPTNQLFNQMKTRFSSYATSNDQPEFYPIIQPNEKIINQFVTYLYATRRIDDKYKYETLAIEPFK